MNNGRKRLSWEETCLRLAYNIADYRSQDPHVQVGACALKKDGNNMVLGYNGCLPKMEIDWSDRDKRRIKVIHAESNVLNRILPGEVDFIAVTCSPCAECIKVIGQKGIKKVVYGERRPDFEQMAELAKEFGIDLGQINIIM